MSRSRRPSNTASPPASSDRGRWSSRRKTEVVLRVLRGEDLDTLGRECGVTAATIAAWRDYSWKILGSAHNPPPAIVTRSSHVHGRGRELLTSHNPNRQPVLVAEPLQLGATGSMGGRRH